MKQPDFISVTFAIDNKGQAYCEYLGLHPFLKQHIKEEMREHIVCNCTPTCGQIYEVVKMENILKVCDQIKADKKGVDN